MKKHIPILIIAGSLALSVACTKETRNAPYNNIETFSIADTAGAPLQASIANNDIILYWPSYQKAPDSIQPAITVSKFATLSPASGVKVAFDSTTVYTVTAQDGSKSSYRLKVANYQPIPYITRWFSVSAWNGLYIIRSFASTLTISGNYFIPDTTKTHAFYIRPDNTEVPVKINLPINVSGISLEPLSNFNFSAGTALKLKLVTGSRTVIASDVLTIGEPLPAINVPTAERTVKPGDTFTLTGTNLTYITDVSMATVTTTTGPYIPLEIVSSDYGSVTLKVPAAYPKGIYIRATFAYKTGPLHAAGTGALNLNSTARRITVTE